MLLPSPLAGSASLPLLMVRMESAKGKYESWFRQNGIASQQDRETILAFMEEIFTIATDIVLSEEESKQNDQLQ